MMFKEHDNIKTIYSDDSGEIISIMKMKDKFFYYIELVTSEGKKEQHVYDSHELILIN